MRGVSTVEGGYATKDSKSNIFVWLLCSGDMTMATWGGSTAQSVDTTGDQSDEEQYDEDYEADTTLQHTGVCTALCSDNHPLIIR